MREIILLTPVSQSLLSTTSSPRSLSTHSVYEILYLPRIHPPLYIQLLYTSRRHRVFCLQPSYEGALRHIAHKTNIWYFILCRSINEDWRVTRGLTDFRRKTWEYRMLLFPSAHGLILLLRSIYTTVRGCICEPTPVANRPRLRPVTSINGLSLKTSKVSRSLCI